VNPGRAMRIVRATAAMFLIAAAAVPWIHSQFVDAAPSLTEPRVRQRLSQDGVARVIVELRLPGGSPTPEGLLSSPAAITLQRTDIATAQQRLLARLAGRSHRILHEFSTVPLVALEIGPDGLLELEASAFFVRRIVEDTLNAPSLPQSVPLTGTDRAWAQGFDGTGTVVAVMDTGVDAAHPFLSGKVVEEACYSSTTSTSSTVCPNGQSQQTGTGAAAPCAVNGCWHGTHVAGIAAGTGATFSGMAKGAQIMAVQVFSRFNQSSDCGGAAPCVLAWTSDIIAGLERVYALRGTRNIVAANLSLGGDPVSGACDSDPTKPIIDNLRSAGIATTIAAGNAGSTSNMSAPACISSAISVGATTKSDAVASFSNVSSLTSLFAPGQSIQSSVPGGGFGVASGTSMAAPHVAGAWAVLRQAAPNATVSQVLSALQTTGVAITDTRSGGSVTKPRIQVDRALAALATPTVTATLVVSGDPTRGPYAVEAQTTASGPLTVNFFVDGAFYHQENIAKYCLFGGDGPCATGTLAAGVHVIKAQVLPQGGSTVLAETQITVTEGATAPTLASLSPSSATAGGPGFTLTVNGTGFVSGASVLWNGATRSTTFVSGTQLNAAISAADIASAGSFSVTVTNPGSGPSNAMTFTVNGAGAAVTLVVTGTPSTGPYAIEAQTTAPGALTINFSVDGAFYHQENIAKYCLFGGDAVCATGRLGAGPHVIKAQVFPQGGSTLLGEAQITVTE
jgi:subtilisin family serine protease